MGLASNLEASVVSLDSEKGASTSREAYDCSGTSSGGSGGFEPHAVSDFDIVFTAECFRSFRGSSGLAESFDDFGLLQTKLFKLVDQFDDVGVHHSGCVEAGTFPTKKKRG